LSIQDIFYINDFNWNVTPSNHSTKEFHLIKERVENSLKKHSYLYDYESDEKELKDFIKNNIANATTKSKIKIDKNNFIPIYLRWLKTVKPIIDTNWDDLKQANIFDHDFYLADLFVDDKNTQNIEDDASILDTLFVVYQNQVMPNQKKKNIPKTKNKHQILVKEDLLFTPFVDDTSVPHIHTYTSTHKKYDTRQNRRLLLLT
jgi:hypothetical protein